MESVHTEIKLTNAQDVAMVRESLMAPNEIRQLVLPVLADNKTWKLTINERIQELLQFPVRRKEIGYTIDGRPVECDVVGMVCVEWENRDCHTTALVMPGDSQPIMGIITMEYMDLVISPTEQKLVGAHHPDYPVFRI